MFPKRPWTRDFILNDQVKINIIFEVFAYKRDLSDLRIRNYSKVSIW